MNQKDQYLAALERLQEIFGAVPADCEEIRIGMRVWFDGTAAAEMYVLTDYLHYGNGRTRHRYTDRADQLPVTQAMIDAVMRDNGWQMAQPQRRSTTEFLYTFTPANGSHCFNLRSKSAELAERRHQQRVFSQYALTA